MFKVSQSKVKCWLRCKRQYYYKYVLNLIQKRVRRPFRFGRIVHSMAQWDIEGDDPFELLDQIELENAKIFDAEREMYGNIIEDIRYIMTAYFDYWEPRDLRFIRRNKKSAEHEFAIDLGNGIIFTGIIDGFARTPNTLKWLVEHKSFTKLPNEDHRWRNLQSGVYIRALQILDYVKSLDGTCWNYIRSKAPTRPQMLKSGALSKKKVDTLPQVVLDVLRENKLDPDDYTDLIERVEGNLDTWFFRIFTPLKEPVVDRIFTDFVATAQEMAELHGKRDVMTLDRHCEWCDYEGICRAELTGGDPDFVKERHYYVRETEEEDEEEAEAVEG